MIRLIKAFIQQRFKILYLRENHNKKLGRLGENLAAKYLEKQGYTLVARNVFLQLGRNSIGVVKKSEIDIIAFDKETLVFVEVKTRSSTMLATPETAVTLAKQKKLIKAARKYKRLIGPTTPHRFDVVSVVWSNQSPTIHLYKNFFEG